MMNLKSSYENSPARGRHVALALLALALVGAPASASFTRVFAFGEGSTIPVAWGDCDADGDDDVAVGNLGGDPNRLYVNQGDGTFVGIDEFGAGTSTFAMAWGDYDNDGDLDLAVGNCYGQDNELFVNQGDATFVRETPFGAHLTTSVAWGDYDKDGDIDLATGNGILEDIEQNYLYVNNGDGTFTEEAQFGSGETGSVSWGDFDLDGDLDLAVGNGGFHAAGANYLYINNGDGTFTERAEFGDGDTASIDWGDSDLDGDLDLAVGNWGTGTNQNMLYINNGDGTFTGQAQFGALDTNTLTWGDADNDGDLDLATGNGDFGSADRNYLYLNNGDGTFTPQTEFGMGSTDALAWGDADGDGDLDMAVGNEHSTTQNYLYVNQENDGDHIILDLVGRFHDLGSGYSNRDGIGAKIFFYQAGHLDDPDYFLGFREIGATGGFTSQDAHPAHLGLPGQATVDIRIQWPGSDGTHFVQDARDVPVGQRLTITEERPSTDVADRVNRSGAAGRVRITPQPMGGAASIEFASAASRPEALEICSLTGQIVRTLTPGSQTNVTWDGRSDAGEPVPAGIYWVRDRGGADLRGRILLVR